MKHYYKQIFRTIDFIEEQLQEELNVEKLSNEAGMSLFHFSRMFKTVTGETPSAYVRKRRLTEAKDEIINDRDIISTAFDYRYNSQESFTNAFSDYFKVPPGKMKQIVDKPIGTGKPLKLQERYIIMDGTKIWRLENIAQQMYCLSQAWAHEAATLGASSGMGLRIVSSETRKLYIEFLDVIGRLRTGKDSNAGIALENISEKTKILTLNSIIEAVHIYANIGQTSLVCSDELLQISHQMNNLIYESDNFWLSCDIPEVKEKNYITHAEFYFIKFNINGIRFCENLYFIKELIINRTEENMTNMNSIDIRGVDVPVIKFDGIDLEESPGFGRYMLVIGKTLNASIAVPIDSLNVNDIYASPLGRNKSDIDKSNIKLREIWYSMDIDQIRFIDWENYR